MYTIGEVSKMFSLPISTLRYYDKEGLIPNIQRDSGIRKFEEKDIETLRVIECLKKSGLEIKEIKQYMDLCAQGNKTYEERLNLFKTRRAIVEEEIKKLNETLDMINYKCWYYENAIKNGDEHVEVKNMPKKIKEAYHNSHANLNR